MKSKVGKKFVEEGEEHERSISKSLFCPFEKNPTTAQAKRQRYRFTLSSLIDEI